MALLSVALAVLACFFFASASEKVRVGIFVLLFAGVAGFCVANLEPCLAFKCSAEFFYL